MNDTPEDSQIILCGMDNEHLEPYKVKANVIELKNEKLLTHEHYEKLRKEISIVLNY
jgi:hypothetical protein